MPSVSYNNQHYPNTATFRLSNYTDVHVYIKGNLSSSIQDTNFQIKADDGSIVSPERNFYPYYFKFLYVYTLKPNTTYTLSIINVPNRDDEVFSLDFIRYSFLGGSGMYVEMDYVLEASGIAQTALDFGHGVFNAPYSFTYVAKHSYGEIKQIKVVSPPGIDYDDSPLAVSYTHLTLPTTPYV